MKFATAIITATVAAVASAKSAWNFPAEGPCVAACTDAAGKSINPHYDDVDSNGPFFFASLSYNYEIFTPNSNAFKIKAGLCIVSCPKKEQKAYTANHPLKRQWYLNSKSTGSRRRRL
ncbi:hypothetical protein BGZ82_007959 [Podila clonocystis]|nr:hypothetical protein BGZ82_007959 [Podila clonocystis]